MIMHRSRWLAMPVAVVLMAVISLAVPAGSAPALAATCPPSGATWSSTSQFTAQPWQGGVYNLNNNQFGSGHGSETIWENTTASPQTMGVCNISQPLGSGNVKAYPDATNTGLTDKLISNYTTISSTFNFTNATATGSVVQFLYDVCLDSACNQAGTTEVGIAPWRHNEGSPGGTFLGNATLNSRTYGVYDASAFVGHTYYVFDATANETSGTIGIRSALSWLATNVPNFGSLSSHGLHDLSGGWEITSCSSGSLTLNSYSTTLN